MGYEPKSRMGQYRQKWQSKSNNGVNPNQNICAQAVARHLGVAESVRYLHNYNDVKRAVGKKYSVRSVMSKIKQKKPTAGGARKFLKDIDAKFFIVWVPGHVLLLDENGKTIVDTAPRMRDKRKILGIHGVYEK